MAKTVNNVKINATFTTAASREQLTSGENLCTSLGKVNKYLVDLDAGAFTFPANGGNADTVNGRTVQIGFFRGISGLNKAGIEIASTDTADAIWKAIPTDSVFATETQLLTDESWNFPAGTTQHSLLIMKLSNNRLLGMYLYPKSGGYVYFANVDGNGSYAGNWRKICDGGDAATLAAHPASDFVLKSDFDALAARVAALEGGTT